MMRIISEFKDYYDSGLAYGQDSDLIYLRRTTVVTKSINSYSFCRWELGSEGCHSGSVYFCGQFFPFVAIGENYYYSLDDVDKFVEKLSKKDRKGYYYINPKNSWKNRDGYDKLRRAWFGEALFHPDYPAEKRGTFDEKNKWAKRMCEESKSPVIINYLLRKSKIMETNGKLSKCQFAKVKDPFTTFQEIAMWLGNQANNEDNIPPVSNKDMIVAKGFDLKSSFRKDKK